VPGVLGLADATTLIEPGCWVRVDGGRGEVTLDSPRTTETNRAVRPLGPSAADGTSDGLRDGPVETLDGRRIRLEANIERPEDIESARAFGAEGIGLYRSEYLLAGRSIESLTEDVQYDVYRRVVADMRPDPVTIRTFDASAHDIRGGSPERRGLHGIRLSLAHPESFRCQLRALLRAAAHGRLQILLPFVSGLEELRAARQQLAEATRELEAAGRPVAVVPVGTMIEVPSAALTVDLLAREADFFSIGTNDLVQHSVAADRSDPAVSHLHEPFHPAVLRMIRLVQRVGRTQGLDVSVCGEMAAEPRALALLVGLGVSEFSMRPSALPMARSMVRSLWFQDVRAAARAAMRGATGQEIGALFDARRAVQSKPGAPVG
jgi:phosphotransferase system enzyme I (PtsI)